MVEIDFTAAQVLLELIGECREQGVTVAVARLELVRAQDAFERFGIYEVLPRDHVFHSVDEAVRKLARAQADANVRMLAQHIVTDGFGLDGDETMFEQS